MAIIQDKTIRLKDVGIPSDNEVPVTFSTRLKSVEFPGGEGLRLTFDVAAGEKQFDPVVIDILSESQAGDPPQDVESEDGTVLVRAGEFRSAIPSFSELANMRLPEGELTAETFGEVLDKFRRQVYLAAIRLNPHWSDGREG